MKKNIVLSILLFFVLFINFETFVYAQKEDKKDEIADSNKPEGKPEEAITDTKTVEDKTDNTEKDKTDNTEKDKTENTEKNKTENTEGNKTQNSDEAKTENAEDKTEEDVEEEKDFHLPIAQLWDTVSTKHIDVNIHCLYEREPQCEIFKKQMKSIIKTIEKAIEIKEKVAITLFLMDLSNLCGECLSIVIPPSFIYVKEVGSDKVYSVPQALAKQLNIEGLNLYSLPVSDFTMVVNVEQDDKDIEQFGKFALIREVLHGMGMITSGDLVNSNSYFLYEEDFYAPQRVPVVTLDDDDVNGVEVTFEKFYPISIFEKNIVTQADPNNYVFDSLNDMYKVQFPRQFYNYMNATEEEEKSSLLESYEPFLVSHFYEPAKKVAQLYKQKGSVGFKAADGKVIPLQTFDGEYIKSCSITHIDIPKVKKYSFYDYDPFNKDEIKDYLNEDFVLYYTYMFSYDMETILSIVGENNKYGFLSPNIIKILTTLGWTEKDNPSATPNVKYKVAEEVKISYDNYWDTLMKSSDHHDYYGFGSFADNLVCHPKAYAMTLIALSLMLGL